MKEWYAAAELANLKLPTIPTTKAGVILRAGAEGWRSRPREGRGGGLEYHVSALPTAAQVKLSLLNSKAAPPAEPAPPPVSRDDLWRWYEAQPDTKKAKARERAEALDAIVLLHRSGVPKDVAVMNVAQHHGVGPSTLYNWLGLVAGRDRSDWLPCLAPRHAGRTVTVECAPDAWEFIKADYLRLERPSFSSAYRRLSAVANDNGWAIPSEKALLARIEREIPLTVRVLAREGLEGAKKLFPAQERDRSTFHALEAVNADGHVWDVWVKWPDGEISRPCMVAIQDLYSGAMLAWRIDKSENREAVRLAIGDMVETYGIPSYMWLDNGRAFASKWISGGSPTRYRFKVRDEEPAGILTQLGIEVHFTNPYSGRSKPIERAFRDLCDSVAKDPRFAGAYTGNSPLAKPENYRSKAIDLDVFIRVVGQGIDEHNMRKGRRSAVCDGRSLHEAFLDSYRVSPIRQATEEQRRLWLLAAEELKADKDTGAIKLFDNRYWCEQMVAHRGERLVARFDPQDLHSGVHVYDPRGVYIGFVPCDEAAGFNDVDKAQERSRKRNKWLRAQKEMLKNELGMSLDEVGHLLDATATEPAPAPEAKVVRPVFGRTAGNLALKPTEDPHAEEKADAFHSAFARGVLLRLAQDD